ncbi:MAG: hypothetical protein P9L92_08090 [Candidatus Electryonea clarkiae]|nr:hypothetical protein [Candidatus Electryonea clarkiae]MDP8286683.1 hypothetical protein [Candidatus Electryonea clarkiae]
MARVVRKYGGSSLKNADEIKHIASRLADMRWQGDDVVVVVSAMASTTDDLMKMAYSLHSDPSRREMDMLLSVGERVSCSLLALAIEAEGVGAVSYTGSQVGIITDTRHGEARIVDIRPDRLLESIEKGLIAVIAGFQGVSTDKEITTLGRGGSDATAVALAASINADRCELMKDIDGLFTADPNKVEDARIIDRLDFDSALRLAGSGATALQFEAARIARDHKVDIGIGNAKQDKIGTIITEAPFDCGDVIGIIRRDELVRKQGCGMAENHDNCIQFVENHGQWVTWRTANTGEEAPYSGITIITAGRPVSGLHEAVNSRFTDASIITFGTMDRPGEYWVCLKTEQADEAVRLVHDLCVEMRWMRKNGRSTGIC